MERTELWDVFARKERVLSCSCLEKEMELVVWELW